MGVGAGGERTPELPARGDRVAAPREGMGPNEARRLLALLRDRYLGRVAPHQRHHLVPLPVGERFLRTREAQRGVHFQMNGLRVRVRHPRIESLAVAGVEGGAREEEAEDVALPGLGDEVDGGLGDRARACVLVVGCVEASKPERRTKGPRPALPARLRGGLGACLLPLLPERGRRGRAGLLVGEHRREGLHAVWRARGERTVRILLAHLRAEPGDARRFVDGCVSRVLRAHDHAELSVTESASRFGGAGLGHHRTAALIALDRLQLIGVGGARHRRSVRHFRARSQGACARAVESMLPSATRFARSAPSAPRRVERRGAPRGRRRCRGRRASAAEGAAPPGSGVPRNRRATARRRC